VRLPSAKRKKRFNEPLARLLETEEVAVNLHWAQVAIAERLERDVRDSGGAKLTPLVLEIIKTNLSKIDLGIDVCELTWHRE
jgi:hypothetical protein